MRETFNRSPVVTSALENSDADPELNRTLQDETKKERSVIQSKEPGEQGEQSGIQSKEPGEEAERATILSKELGEQEEQSGIQSKEPGEEAERATILSKEPGEEAERATILSKESGEEREQLTIESEEEAVEEASPKQAVIEKEKKTTVPTKVNAPVEELPIRPKAYDLSCLDDPSFNVLGTPPGLTPSPKKKPQGLPVTEEQELEESLLILKPRQRVVKTPATTARGSLSKVVATADAVVVARAEKEAGQEKPCSSGGQCQESPEEAKTRALPEVVCDEEDWLATPGAAEEGKCASVESALKVGEGLVLPPAPPASLTVMNVLEDVGSEEGKSVRGPGDGADGDGSDDEDVEAMNETVIEREARRSTDPPPAETAAAASALATMPDIEVSNSAKTFIQLANGEIVYDCSVENNPLNDPEALEFLGQRGSKPTDSEYARLSLFRQLDPCIRESFLPGGALAAGDRRGTSGTKDDLITWKTPPRPPAEGCSPTQEDAADGAPLPLSARGTGTRLDVERNGDSSPLVPMDNADSEEGGQEMMASQSEDPFSPNFVAPVVKKFSQNGHVDHPRPSRLVDGDDTSAPPHRPSTGGSLRNEDSSYTVPVVPPRRGSSGYTPVSSSPAPPVVQTPPVQPPPHRHSVRSTPPPPSRHPEPLTGILVSDAERDELVQENQQLKDRVKELERLLEEEKSTSSSLREDIESNSVLVNLQFEALDQFQTIFQQQQNKIKELEEFLRKERKDLEEEESNLNRVLDKYSRLKDEKKHWEEAALKLQDKYQRLKSEIEEFRREAEGKISITNRELEDLGQQKEMDDARLQAMVRKAESRVSSLEQQLKLKSDEAAELSSICEDLLKRRKQHGK